MKTNKWVLVGDIKGSRKVKDRKKLQEKLADTLEMINERFQNNIQVPFKITLGDEFIGVVQDYYIILEIVWLINIELNEVEVRYGIGHGAVKLDNDLLTGVAYEAALNAVNKAKGEKFAVHLEGAVEEYRDLYCILNIIWHLFFTLTSDYSNRQNRILYYLARGLTQQETADKLDIFQSSVSQSLDKINWPLIKETILLFKDELVYEDVNSLSGFDSDLEYIAVIGCWNRDELETEKMALFLDDITTNNDAIISRPVITVPVGNYYQEFQILLANTCNNYLLKLLIKLCREINDIFLGLGSGDISTELKERAIGMDGSSFYKARAAIEELMNSRDYVSFRSGRKKSDRNFNIILNLLVDFVRGWTERQAEIVRMKAYGLTQQEIANSLKLKSRGTIAKHLKNASWNEFKYLFHMIEEFINFFINNV